jgi:hypothetical protein
MVDSPSEFNLGGGIHKLKHGFTEGFYRACIINEISRLADLNPNKIKSDEHE